jgi:hypothetical protein
LSFKPQGELKQPGVGPAAAILIDGTLIRGILLATIGLLVVHLDLASVGRDEADEQVAAQPWGPSGQPFRIPLV